MLLGKRSRTVEELVVLVDGQHALGAHERRPPQGETAGAGASPPRPAATACGFAFETLGCAEIRAATDVPNAASGAVLRRLGFLPARTTEDGEHGYRVLLAQAASLRGTDAGP